MRKFISFLLVIVLTTLGIVYMPGCYDNSEFVEEEITLKKDDDSIDHENYGNNGANFFLNTGRSARSGNLYYVSPTGDDLKNGLSESNAWKTISEANSVLTAGDTVYIRGGTYSNDPINPTNSGTSENYITYQAYPNEKVTLTGGTAINLASGQDYIKIDGIDISNCGVYVTMKGACYCIFQNCHWESAGSTWYMVSVRDNSDYNKFLNNTIIRLDNDSQKELIEMRNGAQHNLFQNNFLRGGTHAIFTIYKKYGEDNYPASYNVMKDNIIDGQDGCRFFEIRGYPGQTDYNLIDSNVMYSQTPSAGNLNYGLSKVASNHNIIRRNVFYSCTTPHVLTMPVYIKFCSEIKYNKIYHNVFYKNNGVMRTVAAEGDITDNDYFNNIFYDTGNINYADGKESTANNRVYNCNGYLSTQSTPSRIDYLNIDTDNSLFTDTNNKHFTFQSNSPCIDAGRWLTYTIGSGNGNQLTVIDTGFFCDGFGIVNGDLIQLEGQNKTARITKIDYLNNILIIDRTLSWTSGLGVSLPYVGSAPDIGAFEYGIFQPGLEYIEDQIAQEDNPFSLIINISQKTRAAHTLASSTNASWLNWDAGNYTLFGTPSNDDVGSYWICMNYSDGDGGCCEQNFTLTVINVNDPPNIITPDSTTCIKNTLYWCDYDAVDIDPTNDNLYWGLETNASFLRIDSFTGNLSGIPSNGDNGPYWVNISVNDNKGGNDFNNFILDVKYKNTNPQIINPFPDFSFNEDTIDKSINMTYWFIDKDDDYLIYSFTGNKKIDVFIHKTGAVELIPESNWSGTETITFKANDSQLEVEDIIDITVMPVNDAPINAKIETNTTKLYVGQNFLAVGNAFDVDIPYGDRLDYYWYINNSQTHFAEGKVINAPLLSDSSFLTPGKYLIRLEVKDSKSAMCESSIGIEIFTNFEDQPKIVSTTPINNAIDVKVNNLIIIIFNKQMNFNNIMTNLTIYPYSEYSLNWDLSNTKLEISFKNNFYYDTNYTLVINNLKDINGNELINSPFLLFFKTEKRLITQAQSLSIISPTDYSEVGANKWLKIFGLSNGFKEGDQVLVNLDGENSITQIASDGSWSIFIRTPGNEGTYEVRIKTEKITVLTHIIINKNIKTNDAREKENSDNNKKSHLDLPNYIYLLCFILIIFFLMTALVIRKKKKSDRNNESIKIESNLNQKDQPKVKIKHIEAHIVNKKQIPIKQPKILPKKHKKAGKRNKSSNIESISSIEKDRPKKGITTKKWNKEHNRKRSIVENEPIEEDQENIVSTNDDMSKGKQEKELTFYNLNRKEIPIKQSKIFPKKLRKTIVEIDSSNIECTSSIKIARPEEDKTAKIQDNEPDRKKSFVENEPIEKDLENFLSTNDDMSEGTLEEDLTFETDLIYQFDDENLLNEDFELEFEENGKFLEEDLDLIIEGEELLREDIIYLEKFE